MDLDILGEQLDDLLAPTVAIRGPCAIDCTGSTLPQTWSGSPGREDEQERPTLGSVLCEAERELEAATGKTIINAAAKKLMRAGPS